MLTRFTVSNFKGFNSEITIDLENANGYSFHKESIKNGIVNNALIYGPNAIGKSNLGFAIFDILGHLTDNTIDSLNYSHY